jgi:hypothetical protein
VNDNSFIPLLVAGAVLAAVRLVSVAAARDNIRERKVDPLLWSRQYLTTHCMLGMQCLATVEL